MTSPSKPRRPIIAIDLLRRWHTCAAPGCRRRIKQWWFACGQHRALLGYVLSCDMQTAWLERSWRPEAFETLKTQALARWGWKETPCPA